MNPDAISQNLFKHLQRAELLMEVARWREALHELNQHLAAYPDTYSALCNSALCHLELKEFQRAYDVAKRAVEVSPESEWAYRLQSAIFTENGEPKRALDAARMCIEKEPGSPYAIQSPLWAQANYGALDDAERSLESLKEAAPQAASTHEAAGFLALKRNDNSEAEKHFLEALKLNPESVNALNNLGVVYLNLTQSGKGRHYQKKSVEMFERAVKVQPTFKVAQKNISAANDALRFGAPAGVLLLIYWGFRLVAAFVSSLGPTSTVTAKVHPVEAAVSNPFLTLANIYSGLLLLGLLVGGFACLKQSYREALLYTFLTVKGWLVVCALFATSLVSYIAIYWVFKFDSTPPFSGAAFGLSILIVIFSGVNAVKRWNERRS